MFKKGQSGNPNGRRAEISSKRSFAKLGDRAMKVIEDMMDNSEDPKIRFDAAKYLADRAFGKPAQSVEVAGKDGGPLVAIIRDA